MKLPWAILPRTFNVLLNNSEISFENVSIQNLSWAEAWKIRNGNISYKHIEKESIKIPEAIGVAIYSGANSGKAEAERQRNRERQRDRERER